MLSPSREITGMLVAATVALSPFLVRAQGAHDHTHAASGVPLGVPYFCAEPNVLSVTSGVWSDPKIWSTGRVPAARD